MAFLGRLMLVFAIALSVQLASVSTDWRNRYQLPRSQWQSLRVFVYYAQIPVSCCDRDIISLKTIQFPRVISWFRQTLQVPALTERLKIPGPYCGQVAVPDDHRTQGVDAEAVIYVATAATRVHADDLQSYGAACLLSADVPNRVLAGTIWLTMDWYSSLTDSEQMDVLARHTAQVLGFDPLLFRWFSQPNGEYYPLSEVLISDKMNGEDVLLLALPTVVSKAQVAFNCSTLQGVCLAGTSFSSTNQSERIYDISGENVTSSLGLWSAKMLPNDFMSESRKNAIYSDVSLAVFADSGWYEVNWTNTTLVLNDGCDAYNSSRGNRTGICCNTGAETCSTDRLRKEMCAETTNPWGYNNTGANGCQQMKHAITCLYGEIEEPWEEKCTDCRCFSVTHNDAVVPSCLRVVCATDSAVFSFNNQSILCPVAGGSVSLPGFPGHIYCPPFAELCPRPPLCASSCLTCTSPDDRSCLSCYGDAMLTSVPGRCICRKSTNQQCVPCHPDCRSCADTDPFYCITCFANAALNYTSRRCECSPGFYPASADASNCAPCSANCLTCEEPNHCATCDLAVFDALIAGACVCNISRVYDQTKGRCVECPAFCAVCSASRCLTCLPGFSVNGAGFCQLQGGFYWNDTAMASVPCPAHCDVCTFNDALHFLQCLKCTTSFGLDTGGNCVCPQGYGVTEWTNNTCAPCLEALCSECGDWDMRCLTCVAGYRPVLMLKNNVSTSWCYGCPDGLYLSPKTTCEPCAPACIYCEGPQSSQCLRCEKPYILEGKACMCPNRTYSNPAVPVCKQCDSSCLQCFGPNNTQCTACMPGYLLDEDGSCALACQSPFLSFNSTTHICSCPSHTYLNSDHSNCSQCNFPCENCMNRTYCTSCIPALSHSDDGTCACLWGSYRAEYNSCYTPSFLCEDMYCEQCKNGAVAENSECNCPHDEHGVGFYVDTMAGMCTRCAALCVTCSRYTQLCSSCLFPATLKPIAPAFSPWGTCDCPARTYLSAYTETCLACPFACAHCTSHTDCDACEYGYALTSIANATFCTCESAACECPSGTYRVPPLGTCEDWCPSDYAAVNGTCAEAPDAQGASFRFEYYSNTFESANGRYIAQLGPANSSDMSGPLPFFPGNLYFNGTQYMSILSLDQPFTFAASFYIEFWQRSPSLVSVSHLPAFLFSASNVTVMPYDTLGTSAHAEISITPPLSAKGWTLVRYEVTAVAELFTRVRVYLNNAVSAEMLKYGFFFRDIYAENAQVIIGTNGFEAFLGPVISSNSVWKAPICASGDAHCQLSDCGYLQFKSASGLCQACNSSCFFGCTRASDCRLSFDLLCLTYTSNLTCTSCVPHAFLSNGTCRCLPSARFVSTGLCWFDPLCVNYTNSSTPSCANCTTNSHLASTGACACNTGYALNASNACAECAAYYASSEVWARFTDHFYSLVLSFASPALHVECNDVFTLETWELLGYPESCDWGNTTLEVVLGADAVIGAGFIDLVSTKLVKSNGNCTFPATLRPFAAYTGLNHSFESCTVTAFSDVSLSCLQTNVELSAEQALGGAGTIEYTWTLSHSVQGALSLPYSNWSAANSYIAVPVSSLQPGELLATVTLRDRLSQRCSASGRVRLSSAPALAVAFDMSLPCNFTSESQGEIRARVASNCAGSGEKRFEWSFVGASPAIENTDLRPIALLSASNVPSALAIRPSSLAPGHSYTYSVSVSQGNLSGSANVSFSVLSSPLVLQLNRISGDHPNDTALALSTELSIDPDQLPGEIVTWWTCVGRNRTVCADIAGNALLTPISANATRVEVPGNVLKVGEYYVFTATIAKDVRTANLSVNITIVKSVGCSLLLPSLTKPINANTYFSLTPHVTTSAEVRFLWTQLSNFSTLPSTAPTAPFLAFSPNSLSPACMYRYQLTASTSQGPVRMLVDFYVNGGPTGGKATISPVIGQAVVDVFRIGTVGWSDPEANYPLSYQFCGRNHTDGTDTCLTGLSSTPNRAGPLYTGSYDVVVKAVDSLGGEGECAVSVVIFPVSFSRLLSSDFTSAFLAAIDDPEATLSMISIYSRSLVADQSLLVAMIAALQTYLSTVFTVTEQVLAAFIGAAKALAGQRILHSAGYSGLLTKLLNLTLVKYNAKITRETLRQVFEVAYVCAQFDQATYADTTATALRLYSLGQLPSADCFVFAQPAYSFFAMREVSGAIADIAALNADVSHGWTNSTLFADTDILDVHVSVNFSDVYPSFALNVATSGSVSGYNVAFAPSKTLNSTNATAPFNITLYYSPHNASLECIGLDAGTWSTSLCRVLSVTNTSVTISTRSITAFQLRAAVSAPRNQTAPTSVVTASANVTSAGGSGVNPTPCVLAIVICIAGIAAFVALQFVLNPAKETEAPAVKPEKKRMTPSQVEFNARKGATKKSEPDIVLPADDSVLDADSSLVKSKAQSPDDITMVEIPRTRHGSKISASQETVNAAQPMRSLMKENHLILGLPKRPEMAAELVLTLLTSIVTLGIAYRSSVSDDWTGASASEVFHAYSGTDFAFVILAILFALGVSLSAVIRKRIVSEHCAALSVAELGVILYLNVTANYEEGGRWSIGVLIALVLQMGVVETGRCWVVALVQKAIQRKKEERGQKPK